MQVKGLRHGIFEAAHSLVVFEYLGGLLERPDVLFDLFLTLEFPAPLFNFKRAFEESELPLKRCQLVEVCNALTASQEQACLLQAIAFDEKGHHADTELLEVSRGTVLYVCECLVPLFEEVQVQESRVVRLIIVRNQQILAITIIILVLVLEGAEVGCRRNGHGV